MITQYYSKIDIEAIIDRVRPYSVEYLYRYKTCGSGEIEKIFIEHKIRFPNPLNFNDPFDCKPKVIFKGTHKEKREFLISQAKIRNPYLKNKEIKKILVEGSALKKFRNVEYVNSLFDNYKKLFGLYCLSEISDDLLMWSHYADAHRGFCLQFKSDNPDTIFGKAYKITYQEEYPVVNLLELDNFKSCFDIFATKSNHWEYEKEWRIIKTPQEGGAIWYKFDPELLTGIIFGARMKEIDKNKIKKLSEKYPSPISFYQSALNQMEYGLDINLIR